MATGEMVDKGRGWRADPRALVFPLFGLLFTMNAVARAFGPLLLRDAPLLLLALQPDNVQLLLVSGKVGLLPFVAVATARRFSGEMVYYLLGRWYGARALRLLTRWTGGGDRLLARLGRLPWWARDLAVLLLPHPPLLALAGMAGMPPRRYALTKLVGTLASVLVARLAADAAAGPLGTAAAWIEANAGRLTLVFVAVTAAALLLAWYRGRDAAPTGTERGAEAGLRRPA
jgi:membrane protein DedA with SNARE-associated domain